jgi:thiol-disulfide isomerase/thioredoxin
VRVLALLLALSLAACGDQGGVVKPTTPPRPRPTDPNKPEARNLLIVWAAPWCGPCKALLPEIERELAKLSAADRAKFRYVVYVVSGIANGNIPCDQNALNAERQYAPSAERICDNRGKLYRDYGLGNAVSIPAGAVVVGENVQLFRPGTIIASEIIEAAVK